MNGLYTIGLLLAANVFMTLAWYGHLKLQSLITTCDRQYDTAYLGYSDVLGHRVL